MKRDDLKYVIFTSNRMSALEIWQWGKDFFLDHRGARDFEKVR